jgi:hypothetical protein
LSLPSLYEVIKTTINNPLFLEKHRLLKNAFTRNRLLNFPTLILYLLKLRKHSNQEVGQLRMEHEILKKAAVFFAAGSRYFCESLFLASQPKQAAKT